MQERYTKQAENVLALAKEAASSCGHSYIGTEHLLVGLLHGASAGRACRRKRRNCRKSAGRIWNPGG